MLYGFVYLNKPTLAGYAAQVDGGLIAETKTRQMKKKSAGGTAGWKLLGLKGERGGENERTDTFSDAPEAQFQRLLAAANSDPDAIGWTEVLDPGSDFESANVGELISWECDLGIPNILRLMTPGGAASKLMNMMGTAVSGVDAGFKVGGIDGSNLDADQRAQLDKAKGGIDAIKQLLEGANISRAVVGTDSDTNWTVYGTVVDEHLLAADIDAERLLIVGKIKRKLAPGQKRRIVDIPHMSELKRGLRKTNEPELTKEDDPPMAEGQFVTGPALELDILAIYR
ncbi:hypothetical protein MHPYR_710016 [uncultured Mycobacterium sp.]|uniref:Uncharacterized protein n=1 Tax=uncultured Mycobacterium sp. TaxID=171292 RepID=A0A1Y5PPN6_9MYCO|nr:hypothetical protein MHPYR_710016 [uncultured Mycobacterium sp.]